MFLKYLRLKGNFHLNRSTLNSNMTSVSSVKPLSWNEFEEILNNSKSSYNNDLNKNFLNNKRIYSEISNAQSTLRLFNSTNNKPKVTLYRDNHAWW